MTTWVPSIGQISDFFFRCLHKYPFDPVENIFWCSCVNNKDSYCSFFNLRAIVDVHYFIDEVTAIGLSQYNFLLDAWQNIKRMLSA